VIPKRWLVDPAIAWRNRYRRVAKGLDNLNRKAFAFPRLHPPHATEALQSRIMFAYRL
jgi:hypothetical protein